MLNCNIFSNFIAFIIKGWFFLIIQYNWYLNNYVVSNIGESVEKFSVQPTCQTLTKH